MNPTSRQMQVLRLIRDAVEEGGRAPSIQQLCNAMAIRSKNGVAYHLNRLIDKGLLERQPRKAQGLTITELGMSALHGE